MGDRLGIPGAVSFFSNFCQIRLMNIRVTFLVTFFKSFPFQLQAGIREIGIISPRERISLQICEKLPLSAAADHVTGSRGTVLALDYSIFGRVTYT